MRRVHVPTRTGPLSCTCVNRARYQAHTTQAYAQGGFRTVRPMVVFGVCRYILRHATMRHQYLECLILLPCAAAAHAGHDVVIYIVKPSDLRSWTIETLVPFGERLP